MRSIRSPLVAVLVVVLLGGCASYKRGIVDIRPVDQYALKVTSEGVSVAADAFDSADKAKKAFYVDVTSKGYYPIQLIVSNDGTEKVLLSRETIELVDASGKTIRAVRSANMFDEFEKSKMTYAMLGFGLLSYKSAEDANRKMESDWRDKEIAEQLILNPGGKGNGFIYFHLPEGVKPKDCTLKVKAEGLESKKAMDFAIDF